MDKEKKKKVYEKPAYDVEEIFEKMSLACSTTSPPAQCKVTTAAGDCKNKTYIIS